MSAPGFGISEAVMGAAMVTVTSGLLFWMSSAVAANVSVVRVALTTLAANGTTVPLIWFQIWSAVPGSAWVRINCHSSKLICFGSLEAASALAWSAGVGAGATVKLAGGVGEALACVSSSFQPCSLP